MSHPRRHVCYLLGVGSLSLDRIPLHSFCEYMFNQTRPCTCVCYNLSLCPHIYCSNCLYFAPCRKMMTRMTKKKMRTGLLCWSVSRKSQRLASELLFVRVVRFKIAYTNVSEGWHSLLYWFCSDHVLKILPTIQVENDWADVSSVSPSSEQEGNRPFAGPRTWIKQDSARRGTMKC